MNNNDELSVTERTVEIKRLRAATKSVKEREELARQRARFQREVELSRQKERTAMFEERARTRRQRIKLQKRETGFRRETRGGLRRGAGVAVISLGRAFGIRRRPIKPVSLRTKKRRR